MDIIITGEQGAGKSPAAETLIKAHRPKYSKPIKENEIARVFEFEHEVGIIGQLMNTPNVRAVIFDDCIHRPGNLRTAVEAVKEYRALGDDILAIYVAHPDAVVLSANPVSSTDTRKPYSEAPKHDRKLVAQDTWSLGLINALEGELAAKGAYRQQQAARGKYPVVLDIEAANRYYDELRDLWEIRSTTVWPALMAFSAPSVVAKAVQRRSDLILCDLWDSVTEKVDDAGRETMNAALTALVRAANDCCAEPALHHLDAAGKIALHEFLIDLSAAYE